MQGLTLGQDRGAFGRTQVTDPIAALFNSSGFCLLFETLLLSSVLNSAFLKK